jgi:hypothetical protein
MTETKFIVKGRRIPVKMELIDDDLWFQFGYMPALITEIKMMDGSKWHGYDESQPVKMWSVKNSERNRFQIAFLEGKNPYAPFDTELLPLNPPSHRPLLAHQEIQIRHGLTRHYAIFACEMGTGKSLSAIEIMERVGVRDEHDAWYIGPKAGVRAVGRELVKWRTIVRPRMLTYEGLVSVVKSWTPGFPAPRVVIFDESSKLKSPTSQRSQAALYLANAVRNEYGTDGYIIEMSGTPAPKSPIDWWQQAEVACPGFIKEGNVHKFRNTLCLSEEQESPITGVKFQSIITWLDNSEKCGVCGQPLNHDLHNIEFMLPKYHAFQASVNEVDRLYRRLKGLVLVQFKKDCLNLPEKIYEVIQVKPTVEMLRAAKLIASQSSRAATALTLLRELSDGFQYAEKESGRRECPHCGGSGTEVSPILSNGDTFSPVTNLEKTGEEVITCTICQGEKTVPVYERVADSIKSPKDDALIELLDEHEEVGRCIVWGGFTGTVDRLTEICHTQGWSVLRVDGRGYFATDPMCNECSSDDFLDAMDLSNPRYKELMDKHPRICFVGHPEAGGMALTLTASPTEVFYSNSFKGEARSQAEDRFHRTGMDVNRAARIIDIYCLSTDKLVHENLKKKKRLQDVSMGELQEAINHE